MSEKKTPKAVRRRLARSELLMFLATKAEIWRGEITGEASGVRPFEEWPEDDPFRSLVKTYDLSVADVAKLLDGLGTLLEDKAMRQGYEDAWVGLDHLDVADR